MVGTTNRIPLAEVRDLLDGTARACVGYVVDGAPHVEPVVFRFEDGFWVGVKGMQPDLLDLHEVVLVVDAGYCFFDLRAVYVRGEPGAVATADDDDLTWFELEPRLTTCWDYGRLRVDDEAA